MLLNSRIPYAKSAEFSRNFNTPMVSLTSVYWETSGHDSGGLLDIFPEALSRMLRNFNVWFEKRQRLVHEFLENFPIGYFFHIDVLMKFNRNFFEENLITP